MSKRLYIDLEKCDGCEECTVKCSYFYQNGPATDHGILALREIASFALVCRRCEEPSCVKACRFEALERQEDGIMKRYNMRCVSCKCCAQACPFGTIYPETVPFYATTCDFCAGSKDGQPECVATCEKNAVEYRQVKESEEKGIFFVGENLAVRAPRWNKKDV
jgi:Fe-S-cluster-containing hydrogenase component 2